MMRGGIIDKLANLARARNEARERFPELPATGKVMTMDYDELFEYCQKKLAESLKDEQQTDFPDLQGQAGREREYWKEIIRILETDIPEGVPPGGAGAGGPSPLGELSKAEMEAKLKALKETRNLLRDEGPTHADQIKQLQVEIQEIQAEMVKFAAEEDPPDAGGAGGPGPPGPPGPAAPEAGGAGGPPVDVAQNIKDFVAHDNPNYNLETIKAMLVVLGTKEAVVAHIYANQDGPGAVAGGPGPPGPAAPEAGGAGGPGPGPGPGPDPDPGPGSLTELEEHVPGKFNHQAGVPDPLGDRAEDEEATLGLKHPEWKQIAEFYRAGGRVIEAPDQEDVANWADANEKRWSIGIHPGDFLIPVCHQGMNRSQVMRLALKGVVRKLEQGVDSSFDADGETPWVSRAHGAVSGCDAHSAYADLDEMNFFAYLFDEGDIFAPEYDAITDDDPQQGPLQRGFIETFGEGKQPRVGEEMARIRKLNPTSEYTTSAEFRAIGQHREYTHHWFDKWFYAPLEKIDETNKDQVEAPIEQLTIPPPGTTRRIYFAFARAVPNVIARLLEVGGSHNSVVVSLQYDDIMNHELRHTAGKTPEQLKQTMREVHLKAYNMYASLLHADQSPGPARAAAPEQEPEPEMQELVSPGEREDFLRLAREIGIDHDAATSVLDRLISKAEPGQTGEDIITAATEALLALLNQ
jgi:hypothetical protein